MTARRSRASWTISSRICSSDDPAQAKERQRDCCTKLGTWRDTAHATTTGEPDADAGDGQSVQSPEFDNTESAGHTVIEASKGLDRASLELGGTDIVDDTVNAVGGDVGAEGRAVSYCDSSGFETLVRSAG
ncbi:hypothetical protein ACFUIW_10065 [Streptomyces sp. NPDC057245]|uniref:hypothetical protein n=1 Tax=Streptomyces TaxID=1883 RepID=UPI001C1E026B|nr:hypothetical protein [Streptomyces sp. A108]MBU6533941.1 hypothetical protein [Streptomyces sp. A108]